MIINFEKSWFFILHYVTTEPGKLHHRTMEQLHRKIQSCHIPQSHRGYKGCSYRARRDNGYALLVVLCIILMMAIAGFSSMRISAKTEVLSGSTIQRSRAFQSADGASNLADKKILELTAKRAVADSSASEGVFYYDSVQTGWWHTTNYSGAHTAEQNDVIGVRAPPRYLYEELGAYINDGGSGVVNLDRGSASYGRLSVAGREYTMYRAQSAGNGAVEGSISVVETVMAHSY